MADARWGPRAQSPHVVTGPKHEIGHAMLQDGVRAEIAGEIFKASPHTAFAFDLLFSTHPVGVSNGSKGSARSVDAD